MIRAAAALLVCLLLAAALAFPGLGRRPLYSAGEVRVALIAQEMLRRGDYLVPRLNGVRYYEKPPLMYWAAAGAYRVFGVNEFAARFPAALAYVGTVAVVFSLGLTLWGLKGAWLAALIFLTTPAAYHLGRFVSLDALLTFCLSLSLLGLVRLFPGENRPGSRFWGPCLFWLGAALAALTKGLIGLLFPLATAGAAALWYRGSFSWRRLRPGLGLVLLALVFLPWHLALAWHDPDFVPYYLLNEHIYRFLNLRVPLDYERLSIPAFWAAAALWFFPWSLLLPGLLWRPLRPGALPLLFAGLILGFFTLSRCRLEYYGHPAYPAAAVALAGYVLDLAARQGGRLALGLPSLLLGILGALVGGLYFFHPDVTGEITSLVMTLDGYYREYFTKHPEQGFFFAREAESLALPFAAAWLAAGLGGVAAAWRRRPEVAVLVWVVSAFPAAYALDQGIHLVSRDRSQKEAARLIEQHWEDGARLIVAGTYEDLGGVTFYTGRLTEMHRATDGDLLYGWQRGDATELFLSDARLAEAWHSTARVFLLAQVEIPTPAPAWVLLETPRHRLLTNRPVLRSPDPPPPDPFSRLDRHNLQATGSLNLVSQLFLRPVTVPGRAEFADLPVKEGHRFDGQAAVDPGKRAAPGNRILTLPAALCQVAAPSPPSPAATLDRPHPDVTTPRTGFPRPRHCRRSSDDWRPGPTRCTATHVYRPFWNLPGSPPLRVHGTCRGETPEKPQV